MVLQGGFPEEERSPRTEAICRGLSDRVPCVAGGSCGVDVSLPDTETQLGRIWGLYLIHCASWKGLIGCDVHVGSFVCFHFLCVWT